MLTRCPARPPMKCWTAKASRLYRPPHFPRFRRNAQVAQLVEHVTENHGVGGSIPPLGTIPARALSFVSIWLTALLLLMLAAPAAAQPDGAPLFQYRPAERSHWVS